MITKRIFTSIFFILIPLAVLPAGHSWWNNDWRYRRKVSVTSGYGEVRGDAAYIELLTGGELSPDSSSLRIFDNRGILVPYRIISYEPDGITFIAFKANEKFQPYYFYFGCQWSGMGQEPQEEWEPKGGLILRSWDGPKRIANSWEDMVSLMEKKGRLFGIGLRKTIFDGFSPFAFDRPHLSLYGGYLIIKNSGKYTFAISSDGPSFLLIDDKNVVSWPGAHGAMWRGDHFGEIELQKGLHKLEFYYQAFQGSINAQKVAVCTLTDFRNPKKKFERYEIIPPEQFLPCFRVEVGELEFYKKKWCTDLTFKQSTFLPSEFGFMIQYNFYAVERENHLYEWDFGDGIKASGASVEHIYLAPGRYRVTLTEKGRDDREDSFSLVLDTAVEPSLSDYNYKFRVQRYHKWMKEYPLELFKPNELLMIWEVGVNAEDPDLVLRASQKLALTFLPALKNWKSKPTIIKLGMRVAKSLCQDDTNAYPLAKNIYEKIIEELFSDKERDDVRPQIVEATISLGDLCLNKTKDYENAILVYNSLFERGYKLSGAESLIAYAGLGDAHLMKSLNSSDTKPRQEELEKAKEYYNKIAGDKKYTYEQEIALEGSLAQQIEGYIAKKELDGAKKTFDEWTNLIPWKKTEPYYWLLRGKYLLETKKYEEAILSFDMVPRLSNDKLYVPEALYLKGQCLKK